MEYKIKDYFPGWPIADVKPGDTVAVYWVDPKRSTLYVGQRLKLVSITALPSECERNDERRMTFKFELANLNTGEMVDPVFMTFHKETEEEGAYCWAKTVLIEVPGVDVSFA